MIDHMAHLRAAARLDRPSPHQPERRAVSESIDEEPAMTDAIEPFAVAVQQADVDDRDNRLDNARWPTQLPSVDWTRGISRDYLMDPASYWPTQYDWRAAEAQLDAYPQFVTRDRGRTFDMSRFLPAA